DVGQHARFPGHRKVGPPVPDHVPSAVLEAGSRGIAAHLPAEHRLVERCGLPDILGRDAHIGDPARPEDPRLALRCRGASGRGFVRRSGHALTLSVPAAGVFPGHCNGAAAPDSGGPDAGERNNRRSSRWSPRRRSGPPWLACRLAIGGAWPVSLEEYRRKRNAARTPEPMPPDHADSISPDLAPTPSGTA